MPFKFNPFTDKLDEVTTAGSGSGVYTINSISPDGSGNFGINGSANISVTPGVASDTLAITGQIPVTRGGTGLASTTVYAPICGGTTTTAALQSAGTGIGNVGYVLTSTGASSLPDWEAVPSGGITTIDGDAGSVTGATVQIKGPSTATSPIDYSTTTFSQDGFNPTLLVFNVQDSHSNVVLGGGSSTALSSGGNTGVGSSVFAHATTNAAQNCLFGQEAGSLLTDGSYNVSMGFGSLGGLLTGNGNIAIGTSPAPAYASSESWNICLGNNGIVGDSHTIRIGSQGNYNFQQNSCYVAGITGVTTANSNYVTVDTTSGQLGATAAVPSVSSKITKYTSNDTWTIDPNTKIVEVHVFGGGGGGGSGRQGLTTLAGGGGGGAGGGYTFGKVAASLISSPQTITVGASAAGAAAQSTVDTDGNAGTAGNDSSFGSLFKATGGGGGLGGTITTAAGGTNGQGLYNAAVPGSGNVIVGNDALSGILSALTQYVGSGGGGGGADSVTERAGGAGSSLYINVNFSPFLNGGVGGLESTTIDGGTGNTMISSSVAAFTSGGGGGGGGGQSTGLVAGNGGNGGTPSGGGGGGGGSLDGTASGAGGVGSRGEIWVIEYF